QRPSGPLHDAQLVSSPSDREPDQKLLRCIVRANAWLSDLASGRYASIDDLANAVSLHPKGIRQGLRLAFLAPATTQAILDGSRPSQLILRTIPKTLPLAWSAQ